MSTRGRRAIAKKREGESLVKRKATALVEFKKSVLAEVKSQRKKLVILEGGDEPEKKISSGSIESNTEKESSNVQKQNELEATSILIAPTPLTKNPSEISTIEKTVEEKKAVEDKREVNSSLGDPVTNVSHDAKLVIKPHEPVVGTSSNETSSTNKEDRSVEVAPSKTIGVVPAKDSSNVIAHMPMGKESCSDKPAKFETVPSIAVAEKSHLPEKNNLSGIGDSVPKNNLPEKNILSGVGDNVPSSSATEKIIKDNKIQQHAEKPYAPPRNNVNDGIIRPLDSSSANVLTSLHPVSDANGFAKGSVASNLPNFSKGNVHSSQPLLSGISVLTDAQQQPSEFSPSFTSGFISASCAPSAPTHSSMRSAESVTVGKPPIVSTSSKSTSSNTSSACPQPKGSTKDSSSKPIVNSRVEEKNKPPVPSSEKVTPPLSSSAAVTTPSTSGKPATSIPSKLSTSISSASTLSNPPPLQSNNTISLEQQRQRQPAPAKTSSTEPTRASTPTHSTAPAPLSMPSKGGMSEARVGPAAAKPVPSVISKVAADPKIPKSLPPKPGVSASTALSKVTAQNRANALKKSKQMSERDAKESSKGSNSNEKDSNLKSRDPSKSGGASSKQVSQESMNIKAAAAALIKEQQQGSTVPSLMKRYQIVSEKIRNLDRKKLLSDQILPFHLNRLKTHWDYLLDEVQWMSLDYHQERRWKQKACGSLASLCAEKVRRDNKLESASQDCDPEAHYAQWVLSLEDSCPVAARSEARKVSRSISAHLARGLLSTLLAEQKQLLSAKQKSFSQYEEKGIPKKTCHALVSSSVITAEELAAMDSKIKQSSDVLNNAERAAGGCDMTPLTDAQREAAEAIITLNANGLAGLVSCNTVDPLSAQGGSMNPSDIMGGTGVGAAVVCSWLSMDNKSACPVLVVTGKHSIYLWKHEIRRLTGDSYVFGVLGEDFFGSESQLPDVCFCTSYEVLESLILTNLSSGACDGSTVGGKSFLTKGTATKSDSTKPSSMQERLERFSGVQWGGVFVDLRRLSLASTTSARSTATAKPSVKEDDEADAPWNPSGYLFSVPDEPATESTGKDTPINAIQNDYHRVKDALCKNYVSWLKAVVLLLNLPSTAPLSGTSYNSCCLSNFDFLSTKSLREAFESSTKISNSNASTASKKSPSVSPAVALASTWLSFSIPSAFSAPPGPWTQSTDLKSLLDGTVFGASKWMEYRSDRRSGGSLELGVDEFLYSELLPSFSVQLVTKTPRFVVSKDPNSCNILSGSSEGLTVVLTVEKVAMTAAHRKKYESVVSSVCRSFALEGGAIDQLGASLSLPSLEKEKDKNQEKTKKMQEDLFAQALVVLRRLCFHERCVSEAPLNLSTTPPTSDSKQYTPSKAENVTLASGLNMSDVFPTVQPECTINVASSAESSKFSALLKEIHCASSAPGRKVAVIVESIEEQLMTHKFLQSRGVPHLYAGALGDSAYNLMAKGQNGNASDDSNKESKVYNWYSAQKAVMTFNESKKTCDSVIVVARWLVGDDSITGEAHQLLSSFTTVLPTAATDIIALSSDWVSCLTEVDYSTWWSYSNADFAVEKRVTRIVYENSLEDTFLGDFSSFHVFGNKRSDQSGSIAVSDGYDTASIFSSLLHPNVDTDDLNNCFYWKNDVRVRCPLAVFQGSSIRDVVSGAAASSKKSSENCIKKKDPSQSQSNATAFSFPDAGSAANDPGEMERAHSQVSFLFAAPLLTPVINEQEELTRRQHLLSQKEQFVNSCKTPVSSGQETSLPTPQASSKSALPLGRGMGKGLLAQGQDGKPVQAELLPWRPVRKADEIAGRAAAARRYLLGLKRAVQRAERVMSLSNTMGGANGSGRMHFSSALTFTPKSADKAESGLVAMRHLSASPLDLLSYKLTRVFQSISDHPKSLLPRSTPETPKKKALSSAIKALKVARSRSTPFEVVFDVLWALDEHAHHQRIASSGMVCALCNILLHMYQHWLESGQEKPESLVPLKASPKFGSQALCLDFASCLLVDLVGGNQSCFGALSFPVPKSIEAEDRRNVLRHLVMSADDEPSMSDLLAAQLKNPETASPVDSDQVFVKSKKYRFSREGLGVSKHEHTMLLLYEPFFDKSLVGCQAEEHAPRGVAQLSIFRETLQKAKQKGQLIDSFIYTSPLDMSTGRDCVAYPSYLSEFYAEGGIHEIAVAFKGCEERRFSSFGKEESVPKRGMSRKKADSAKDSVGKEKEKVSAVSSGVSSLKESQAAASKSKSTDFSRFSMDGSGWRCRAREESLEPSLKKKRLSSSSASSAHMLPARSYSAIDSKKQHLTPMDPYRVQPFHSSVIMAGMRLLDTATGNSKKKPWTELETKALLDMSSALQASVSLGSHSNESDLEASALSSLGPNQKPLPVATHWLLEKVLSSVAPLAALSTVFTKNQSMHSAQDAVYQYKFQARQQSYKKQREQAELHEKAGQAATGKRSAPGAESRDPPQWSLLPSPLPRPQGAPRAAANETQAKKRVRSLVGLTKVSDPIKTAPEGTNSGSNTLSSGVSSLSEVHASQSAGSASLTVAAKPLEIANSIIKTLQEQQKPPAGRGSRGGSSSGSAGEAQELEKERARRERERAERMSLSSLKSQASSQPVLNAITTANLTNTNSGAVLTASSVGSLGSQANAGERLAETSSQPVVSVSLNASTSSDPSKAPTSSSSSSSSGKLTPSNSNAIASVAALSKQNAHEAVTDKSVSTSAGSGAGAAKE